METEHITALISAAAVIVGIVIGKGWDVLSSHIEQAKKKSTETTYLVALVSSHLDRFFQGCVGVAGDDGVPSGLGGEYESLEPLPQFNPLNIDVNWKVLPNELMYSILRLPDQHQQIKYELKAINEFELDPPYHSEFFKARRRLHAQLALEVAKITKSLRSHAKLTTEKRVGNNWDQEKWLEEVLAQTEPKTIT